MTQQQDAPVINDTPLLVVPFAVRGGRYSVMIVLQEHNLARLAEHDPVVLPWTTVERAFSGSDVRLEDVIVVTATPEDARKFEEMARAGEMRAALRHLVRGYRNRPGDDAPIEHIASGHMILEGGRQ